MTALNFSYIMDTDKTLLSRYKIVKKLGRGGFGYTYLAQDTALPSHPYCVVKHLSPKNPNPNIFPIAKKLFDREAQFLYRLGEDNDQIPRLYAHFCEEGQFYLVQEFIEGNDLSKEIKIGKKWSEEQTIKLLREILEVLKYIHQENVIHRDIKPSNIMRRKRDQKLVLIDFGSVKDLSASMNTEGQKTVGIGSHGYMPPEQSNGHPQLSSDLYAVGMLAIQTLTGVKPDELPKTSNNQELIWRSKAEVSESLADFIDKMICHNFNQRYQNASQALAALHDNVISADLASDRVNSATLQPVSNSKKINPNIIKSSLAGVAVVLGVLLTAIIFKGFSNSSYSELEGYLSAKEWQKADQETDEIVLEIAGNPENLDKVLIENLNCEKLEKIDQLWLNHSDGLFGFSVQKQLYLETGNDLDDYSEQAAKRFADLLKQELSELSQSEGAANQAPRGYYPTLSRVSSEQNPYSEAHWLVIVRAKTCGL